MKALLIVNDPPYGTERCYNALRLALTLTKKDPPVEVTLFLIGDALAAAKGGQKTPAGFYNIEHMLKRLLNGHGEVLLCGSCMDARGLEDVELVSGARRSTMDELASATIAADKVLVF